VLKEVHMPPCPRLLRIALAGALGACASVPYHPRATTVSHPAWETFLTCARTMTDGTDFRSTLTSTGLYLLRPALANSSGMNVGGEQVAFLAVPVAGGLEVTSNIRVLDRAAGDRTPAAPSLAARTLRQRVDQQCLQTPTSAASAAPPVLQHGPPVPPRAT
jgi:hypothetical protein